MPNLHLGIITSYGIGKSPIQKVTVIEAVWTECPDDVFDEIRQIWEENEYGNDVYYHSWPSEEEYDERYPAIAKYIKDNSIEGDILIHYWW